MVGTAQCCTADWEQFSCKMLLRVEDSVVFRCRLQLFQGQCAYPHGRGYDSVRLVTLHQELALGVQGLRDLSHGP